MRDSDNVKALFRRGRARVALGQTEEAVTDLERALKLWVAARLVRDPCHA
jgi:hypothetical protein